MPNATQHATHGFFETLYGGVDMTHINDGGMECAKQGNSHLARLFETLLGILHYNLQFSKQFILFP